MDLLYFLTRRLEFVQKLYECAVEPFEETLRKINAQEPPYVWNGDPERYYGDPPFLEEAQEAGDSVMVIGHWCLCMVEASLQAYLRDSISPIGAIRWNSSALRRRLGQISMKKKKASWFDKYRLLFFGELRIDWNKGPVSLKDLEQLNLTRNSLVHEISMLSFNVKRDRKHAEKYPTGLFTDDLWASIGMERIHVDRAKLELAIELVNDFCAWLEGIRCHYPRYVRAIDAGEPWPPA